MTASKRTFAGATAAIALIAAGGAFVVAQHGGRATLPSGTASSTAAPAASDSRATGPHAGQAQAGKGTPGANKGGDKPLWRTLSAAQQQALLPLRSEWDQMDGVRKQKWLQLANRFASMPPAQQERVHERMREWVRLTPEQRELARDTYNRTRKIAPDQKTATWESYQQLPEEQKRKLAAATRKAPAVVPSQANGKTVPPLGQGATACPAGMVKNPVSATPPCVAAPAAPATAPTPPQPATPATPTPPVQQEKPVPANWGITPNDA